MMITKRISLTKLIVISTVSFMLNVDNLFSQYGISNARSVAMGGAYTAVARGVESPAWNPANLGLSGDRKYRLNLLSIGVGIHNNSFTKSHYDLYNGKFLTERDKKLILDSIPAEGFNVGLGTEVQAMGINIGSFAVTSSGLGASNFVLSKDIFELILNGNELNRVYDVGGTGGEGWGVSSFAFSMAMPLPFTAFEEFTVGTSVKYIRGFAYAKVMEAASTITTNADGVHGNGKIVIDRSLGGTGLGFDFGAAAKFNKEWSFSLGVTNAINNIKWRDDTKRFTYTFQADSVSIEKIQNSDIDSVFIDSEETVDIEPFETSLPTQIRLGIARATKHFTFAIDVSTGLKRAAAGVSNDPRLAVGAEFRLIDFLPLRSGIAFGDGRGVTPSAGFALDFSAFSLDFAFSSQNGIFPSKGLGFAFDWMFRF